MGSEMGSLGTQEKKMVITQVSFGGFDENITAEDLTNFLENEFGMIWRCRLKNSWTPPESYPNFDPNFDITNPVLKTDDYEKVAPHAFVHFASPEAATAALEKAGHGDIIFKQNPLMVNLGPKNTVRLNQQRKAAKLFKFSDVILEVGTLVTRNEFLVGWKGPISGVDFVVDPFDGTCKFLFTKETAFSFKGKKKHAVIKCNFKVEFLVRSITKINRYNDNSSLVVFFQLESSPHLFYRTADDDIYESVPFNLLDDDDPWIRTTDFTPGEVIGRCSSYRICMSPRFGLNLERAMNYFKELRIPNEILKQKLKVQEEPNYGCPISSFFFCIPQQKEISFDVMFLVNAVIQKGIINYHQLSDKFFELLRSQRSEVSITALRHICSYRLPVFDACKRLKLVQEWLIKNPKLLKSSKTSIVSVEVRRLVITPTKAYCLPPVVELSNRVLRKFKEVADRFLRVTFMDEGMQQLNSSVLNYYVAPIVRDIKSNSFPQKTSVFQRVSTISKKGFNLCGRQYNFLAFSSNQLRGQSAWFFAEDKNITVHVIKSWMGKFRDKNVAKCAARIGLCFSSTYATLEVPWEKVNLEHPEIERNGYCFSDGIGMLTPDLATQVAEKLQLSINAPSAYQIRFAGCKGVIACWPGKDDGARISLRQSMNKFESDHNILEVVSWTRFQPGFLNRQIITLLSALAVPDDIFLKMQDTMVFKLDQMVENSDIAFEVITSSCEQGNTAAMMLSAGFEPQTEPHLRGMLASIKAAQLGDLRNRARIFVPEGRWLMGCMDELGVLEAGQCFIQVSTPSLENCFAKHGPAFCKTVKNLKVIQGTVSIAKNPCLHPGDIRILEAVDAPGLDHLVDCLVFPQKGDRPHTNEASGSDLDGDLYFATWDANLIPPDKKSFPPMDYSPAEVKKQRYAVTTEDIKDFFVKNMVNANLGTICNAHVVHADRSEYGALDKNCIRLAELAAIAVDFPKTGKIVTIPQDLKPKVYPDFMEKEDFQSYKSDKILGRLYHKIIDSSLKPLSVSGTIPYDLDLELPGSADFILDAWDKKCSYDRQIKALMAQYKVNVEEEVVTGHVWSMPKYNSRKQSDLKEKLKQAYRSLKKEFKHDFENLGQDFQQLSENERNTLYEQKASAWYQVTYHPQWVMKSLELIEPETEEVENGTTATLLSFGWIPVEYLVKVKIRCRAATQEFDTRKPINTLAQYLAQRI